MKHENVLESRGDLENVISFEGEKACTLFW